MADTLTFSGKLVVTVCWCGISHAVPQGLYDHMNRQHNDGERQGGIYCPLGHSWTFAGKGNAEIEREKRERAERDAANARENERIVKAELTAAKTKATKLANRAKGGACPCCNRTFVQLSRHIATKHPNFSTEQVTQ